MIKQDKVGVNEIGDFISHEFGIDKKLAAKIVVKVVEYMIKSILRGQILNLRNFCTVSSISVPPSKKYGLGKAYFLPERRKMKITWSKALLESLNTKEVKNAIKSLEKEDEPTLDINLLEKLKNNLGS